MASTKSAARYAKALLDLSLEKGWVEAVEKDLNRFLQVVKESDDFRVFLNSPIVRDDKKIAVYQQVFNGFSAATMQFFALVTKNGREQLLPEIAHQFDRQLMKHRGIVSGSITSAIALSQETKQAILTQVAPAFEGTLQLTEAVDPSLLGGFVIRIEDKQIDASVAHKLKELRQELVK
ncbi:MAG: ATP synthase F1 subunit delta [Flavobacteriales bacterium]